MARKVFVEVCADFQQDGRIMPRSLVWEDGKRYEIDRIIDICPAPSLKAGGQGLRYTCEVKGTPTYMFFESGRWFVESKM